MRSTRIRYAAAALFAVVATSRTAHADRSVTDPWLGKDKAYHFAASATISAGGYAVGAFLFDARGYALITGAALSLEAGIGKETLDLAGFGDPSWKDLTWDCIGNVAGLAVAWGADMLIRGVGEKHPLLIAPRLSHDAVGFQVMVTF